MKVDVVTVNDVVIGKFRWWSNWIDVCVFNFGGYGYLLQMSVSRRNAKRFRASSFRGYVAHADCGQVGDLVQMRREQK